MALVGNGLNDDERAQFSQIFQKIHSGRSELRVRDNYYDGLQRIENLGIAIPPELELFLTMVNWPRIAVDSVEERLTVVGFRTGDQKEKAAGSDRKRAERIAARKKAEQDYANGISTTAPDPVVPGANEEDDDLDEDAAELWRIWQANDLDSEAPLGHLESLILRDSYIAVGADEDDEDTPLITIESPYECGVLEDPRRPRSPQAGLKIWCDNPRSNLEDRATFWTRTETVELETVRGKWKVVERFPHDFDLVPLSRMANSPRLRNRRGRSEIDDVMSLTDAAARTLTNLQVAGETHALPSRGIIGASKNDFVDATTGKQLGTWETYFGAFNALTNPDAKTFQFSSSDLRNFHETVLHYARLVSAVTGLPPHYLGMSAEQPPSAEAIKSVEARLVKRVERRQEAFGSAWERSMYIVQLMTGQVKLGDPRRGMLEVLWRDAGTPTQAQVDDGAVKKKQAGILSVEGAMEMTGMGPVAIARELRRLKKEQQQQAELDPITGLQNQLRQGQPGTATSGGASASKGTPGSNPATSPLAQGRGSTERSGR